MFAARRRPRVSLEQSRAITFGSTGRNSLCEAAREGPVPKMLWVLGRLFDERCAVPAACKRTTLNVVVEGFGRKGVAPAMRASLVEQRHLARCV